MSYREYGPQTLTLPDYVLATQVYIYICSIEAHYATYAYPRAVEAFDTWDSRSLCLYYCYSIRHHTLYLPVEGEIHKALSRCVIVREYFFLATLF